MIPNFLVFWVYTFLIMLPLLLCEGSVLDLDYGDPRYLPLNATQWIGNWPESAYREYAVSLPALYRLVVEENSFYKVIKSKYANASVEVIGNFTGASIKTYVDTYEEQVEKGIGIWARASGSDLNFLSILNHPLLIYQMLRRVLKLVPLQLRLVEKTEMEEDFPADITQWPTEDDTNFYARLILLLLEFYDFPIEDFCAGKFGGISTGVNLTLNHVLDLALTALKTRRFSLAVELMAYASALSLGLGAPSESLHSMFEQIVLEHDEALSSFMAKGGTPTGLFAQRIETVENFMNGSENFETFEFQLKERAVEEFYYPNPDVDLQKHLDYYRFMNLCAGDNYQTEETQAQLFCTIKLALKILPFKLELLSLDPFILKIHQFTFAYENQALSAVPSERETEGVMDNKLLTDKLERRLELIVNLNVRGRDAGEDMYVTSSIPGGHVMPHIDSGSDDQQKRRPARLATFMIYLSPVDLGGHTVFHRVGLSIKPEVSSALLWLNHYPNGRGMLETVHGGCPVVLGHKWLATKFIRWKGNWLKYKCSSEMTHSPWGSPPNARATQFPQPSLF